MTDTFPLLHVCTAMQHKCSNFTYGDASQRLYFCCNYCSTPCRDECKNDSKVCNVHAMRKARERTSDGRNQTLKAVLKLDPVTREVLMRFESGEEAARHMICNGSTIRRACIKKCKHKGFLFEWEEDYYAQQDSGTEAV